MQLLNLFRIFMKSALKYNLKFNLCIIFFSVLLLSCTRLGSNTVSEVEEDFSLDEKLFSESLDSICRNLSDSVLPELKFARVFYTKSRFKSFWFNNSYHRKQADTLLMFLKNSTEHGIPESQFDADNLIKSYNKVSIENTPIKELALLDLKLSVAYIRYCSALNFGLVQPLGSIPNYYFKTLSTDSAFVVQMFQTKESSISKLLHSLAPKSEKYKKLQSERKKLISLADSIKFVPIPYNEKSKIIELGDTSKLVPVIARRLKLTGELTDASRYNQNYQVFDSVLLNAINKLRLKTGQFIDNEIGNNTIRALNYTVNDYIAKIDANLERLRWKTAKPLGKKYIIINVADMTLAAYRDDTLTTKMKVCVGKPPLHKTPFLQSNINKIILNPSWSIPRNIVVKETSLMAANDSNYLKRNRIRVYANGAEISPSAANWRAMQNREVSYQLVQEPGGHNALGRIKFSFPNPFAVYLHDTNAKKAFSRHNRAISHGCVRLEKPLELCFYALPDLQTNDSLVVSERLLYHDKIRYSIQHKVVTKQGENLVKENPASMKLGTILLSKKIPLLINYFTFSMDSAGEIIFRDDIYEMDKYVIDLLNKPVRFTMM